MLSLDYCLLVFIAVVGVIQLAALYNNLRGLLFFPRRIYTLSFACIAIAAALFAFFTWNDFHKVIVEGSQQTGSFVTSAAAAIIFTLICSSILNSRRLNPGKPEREGLEGLRKCTYFQAVNNHWGEEE
jgi:uncharacterized membrane protein YhfC